MQKPILIELIPENIWLLSFNGNNPKSEECVELEKEKAIEVKTLIDSMLDSYDMRGDYGQDLPKPCKKRGRFRLIRNAWSRLLKLNGIA
jgi:hypothetical protein